VLHIIIQKTKKADLNKIATFIARMNTVETQHVGYCGTDIDEIYHYLSEEFEDMKAEECFFLVQEGNEIIALLGYEPDFERGLGELWGPFVQHENWHQLAQELYKALIEDLPREINKLSLFSSSENQNHVDFAEKNNFQEKKGHYILYCEKSEWNPASFLQLNGIEESQYESFKLIYDKNFPGTYYSGQHILDRLDEDNRVFVVLENDNLAGYIYVESEKEFNEGTIHFIAVKNSERGKGFGKLLLQNGVKYLFDADEINSLELCVNAENTGAIKLYESAGFKTRHKMYAYTKVILPQ